MLKCFYRNLVILKSSFILILRNPEELSSSDDVNVF